MLSSSLDYLSYGNSDRFRFISYHDSTFSIYADPISGYDVNSRSGEQIVHGKNGADVFGQFGKYLGFHLTFYDNTERGNYIDFNKDFTEQTGLNYKIKRINSLDYDDVTGSLIYSWKWGDFSLAKDYMRWGSGRAGQIILSDKAPSFPMIRLNVYPADWINFTYIHGYLNSGAIDSSTIRMNTMKPRLHYE
jgi:hypothetical protein